MFRILPTAVLLLAAVAVILMGLFPQLTAGLSVVTPFSQGLAFVHVAGMGLAGLSLIWAAIMLLRRGRRLTLVIAVTWLIAGLVPVLFPSGVLYPRANPDDVARTPLRIVTFNAASTLTGADLQQIIDTFAPDVMVLPETSSDEVERLLRGAGFRGKVFGTPDAGLPPSYTGQIEPTTVVVRAELGEAHLTAGPVTSFGTVALKFDDPKIPTVVAVHTAPPLPALVGEWRGDLDRVTAFAEGFGGPVIIAGDFNATLRHGPLARRTKLVDSAQQCGREVGTWHTRFPGFMRSPIDHVFITPDLDAQDCRVADIGRSDHAAYVTTVLMPRT
ncbi:endonuclease/exonuclease/phosphatase family protein [Enemella sp. A6]|uniref:endonuclease/exonuclease/phosphatase family protein n=1 Tax=Enemella sp. A6 TaxID=3440152 RepID=UPI003EB907B5